MLNETILITESSPTINFAFIFVAATFTWLWLIFKIRSQTSFYTHLSVIEHDNETMSSTKMQIYGIPEPI